MLKSRILKAVAYPPTILFVPLELAGLIATGHISIMLLGIAIFDLNPVFPFASLIACWIGAMIWSSKEPHLVTLAKTVYHPKLHRRTRNIVKSEGAKYVP